MKLWVLIVLYMCSSIAYVFSKELEIDNIKAIVNDQIILNSDVNNLLFLLQKKNIVFRIPLKNDFLKEKAIEKLILDELILQEANKMNILVTPEQINTVIKNMALKKNISIDELKKNIFYNNIHSHFIDNSYVENIKKLLKTKIIQDYQINKRVSVSEQEVNILLKKMIENNKKLKKINFSYILLPFSKSTSIDIIKNKKKLAMYLVSQIKKGYNFEKLYIECKKNNSVFLVKNMISMSLLDIQKNFYDVLNIAEKGQILGPIVGKNGIYILKINNIDNYKENIVTELYVQHCLIKPSVLLTDIELKNNIFDIYRNIKKGIYNFNYAVKNFSDDVYSSRKNGDIGWISQELFKDYFQKELLCLKKNEISKPIKSIFGWHIFKLLDRRQIDKFYNLKKKQAYKILFFKKATLEKYHWIENLKNLSYIKVIRP